MKIIRKNLWIPSLISSIKSELNKKFKHQDSHGNIKFSTNTISLISLTIYKLNFFTHFYPKMV